MISKILNKINIKVNKFSNNLLIWKYKSQFKWNWLDFYWFREYNTWDDSKKIDWLVSWRENKLVIREYIEDRNIDTYFIVDSWTNFNFKSKIKILLNFIYSIWITIIKSWDNLGFYCKNLRIKPKNSIKNLYKWLEIISNINFNNSDNFNLELNKISKNWIKNGVFFIFTDKLDLDFKLIKKLWIDNKIIFINIFDSFENTLEWKGILWFWWFFDNLFINLSDIKKKEEYRRLRADKINKIKVFIEKQWWIYLYLDEKKDILKEFIKVI